MTTIRQGATLAGIAVWVYAAWLALLMLMAFAQQKPAQPSAEAQLATAGALLEKERTRCGAYPLTRDEWVAIPLDVLDQASQGSLDFARFLSSAKPWGGNPGDALIFRSDGRDFKLLQHGQGGCAAIHSRTPALVDPVRTTYSRKMIPGGWEVVSADEKRVAPIKEPMLKQDPSIPAPLFGKCWAYGVWTPGAVFW